MNRERELSFLVNNIDLSLNILAIGWQSLSKYIDFHHICHVMSTHSVVNYILIREWWNSKIIIKLKYHFIVFIAEAWLARLIILELWMKRKIFETAWVDFVVFYNLFHKFFYVERHNRADTLKKVFTNMIEQHLKGFMLFIIKCKPSKLAWERAREKREINQFTTFFAFGYGNLRFDERQAKQFLNVCIIA